MNTIMTEEVILNGIELINSGVKRGTAVALLGISDAYYSKLLSCVNKAKANDVEGLLHQAEANGKLVRAVAKHFCIDITPPKEVKQVNTDVKTVPADKAPAADNTALVMVQILKELREMNESLHCLMDADLAKLRESVVTGVDDVCSSISTLQGVVDKIRSTVEESERELDLEHCVNYILKLLRKNSGSQTESYLDSKLRLAGYDDTVIANSKQWLCDNAKVYLRYTGSGASRVTQLVLK